ncbi:DNA-3-methyladenine glycosylase [Methylobacterium sp. NEAU K]|uniref:DNA-3-methyladenine glycosylase family protein n=1 Tax=Methylobacterium sp. NEAU K TaxID=3064946 RepID=UPI002736DA67|nr:AlkA N-terminal domain-containing protein [Methylobacterium sp. NEAU K]MDP4002856.1 AlkA N-terminal domain-containing protein [Methylobacterium sp. NEAU K]
MGRDDRGPDAEDRPSAPALCRAGAARLRAGGPARLSRAIGDDTTPGTADGPPLSFPATPGVTFRLPCRLPYDWAAIRAFLVKRAIPGVEAADPGGRAYARTVSLAGRPGILAVEPGGDGLRVALYGLDPGCAREVAERLRRLFDCDADPAAIAACLSGEPALAGLVAQRPGLRLPGAWDPFETACRAILGQQVSVAAAIRLAGRLVAAFGTRLAEPVGGLTHVFPAPAALVEADVSLALNMPRSRGAAIQAMAAAALADPDLFAPAATLEAAVLRFTAIRGIGPWTAQYIAMRALKLPDALPVGDVGLLRALDVGAGRPSPAALLARAEAWRPYRAYAAQHLWTADEAAARTW